MVTKRGNMWFQIWIILTNIDKKINVIGICDVTDGIVDLK